MALALALTGGMPVSAQPLEDETPQPVWEAGLGATALSLPDYRGADRQRGYLLPLPYFVYRSPRLNVDRGGIRAELLDRGRLELDFSVNLSAPVRSDDNPVRAGMPRLRPALELGPQLKAELWRAPDRSQRLQLQLPLRYAFTLSGASHDVGFVFHPRLAWDVRNALNLPGWNVGVITGPLFATTRHHDYFYGVDARYATATRPAYRAASGYGGWQTTLAISKRFAKHWVGGFVRLDQIAGAVFDDSPLVRRRSNVSAGIAFTWVFAESAERTVRR